MNLFKARGSIRGRLFVQLAAIAAILSLAFFFTVRVLSHNAAENTQDNLLLASATSIADAIYLERENVRLEIPYSALSMLGTASDDRVFYRVLVDGQTLTGYDDLPLGDDRATFSKAVLSTVTYRGDAVRLAVIARPLSTGNQVREAVVVVGQTQFDLASISSGITTSATAIGVAFFLTAIALSALAARSALLPIDRLTTSLGRRGPTDLRPVTAQTPKELKPLVDGLNNFMERLGAALNRSEDLIAEAAHRVRTPLATVRTQAEVIHRTMKRDENRRAVREMIRAVDESSRSAGQLLDHAMVTFRSEHLEPDDVDLPSLLQDTVDRLMPTAELRDIRIYLEIPEGSENKVEGDKILLQSAMRNILDNAIKYSPDETDIHVAMDMGNPCVIRFIDQGRGFPPDHILHVTKRFSRGTNVENIVGSGLGLTIAKDVAITHGGNLIIENNKEGIGACVSFVLPLSS